jgi:hypothetical protein
MLAAALHLVNVIGPHAVELAGQVRAADRDHSARADGLKAVTPRPSRRDHAAAGRIRADRQAAPADARSPCPGPDQRRLVPGRPADPDRVQCPDPPGRVPAVPPGLADLRGPAEAALKAVGAERPFGRAAAWVERADGQGAVPWTLPLHREQATSLVGIVRSATVLALAAITGMRAGEPARRRRLRRTRPGRLRLRKSGPQFSLRSDQTTQQRRMARSAGLRPEVEQLLADPEGWPRPSWLLPDQRFTPDVGAACAAGGQHRCDCSRTARCDARPLAPPRRAPWDTPPPDR